MSSLGTGEGVPSIPGISEGLPSMEVGWMGQTGNHMKPSHDARDLWEPAFVLCILRMWLFPHFYLSFSICEKAAGASLLHAFRCGKGSLASPTTGPKGGGRP